MALRLSPQANSNDRRSRFSFTLSVMLMPYCSKSSPSLGRLNLAFSVLLATCVALMGGCDPFATGTVGASVTGTVVNTTGLGIDSAQVTLLRDGSTVRQVRSRSDGSYSIDGVDGGTYSLRYSAVGYPDSTFEISVNPDESLEAAAGKDTLVGPASVTGKVLDSRTGGGVAGATVLFAIRTGAGAQPQGQVNASMRKLAVTTPDFITETDESGNYEVSGMPTGMATRTVRDSGFFDETTEGIVIDEGMNRLDPAPLPEEVSDGNFRIVLSWGENPSDLDSHLTGPDGSGGRFHVFWSRMNAGNAELDVDDVTSFGPETITIEGLPGREGLYRYSVQNYSNRTSDGATGIESSPAEIKVYDTDGLLETYSPPPVDPGDGDTWRVFEILVTDGTVSIDDGGGETLGYFLAGGVDDVTTFSRGPGAESRKPALPSPVVKDFDEDVEQNER